MTRKANLNNSWNNVQRVNKQNKFVPSAVLTRTGIIPVSTARASSTKNFSTARQSFNRQTVLTNAAMKVNTVKPIVNRVRPANVFHKTHSPTRPFKKTTVLRPIFSNQKFNTAKVNAVSTVGGKREIAVKSSADCSCRPQRYHDGSKYNSGSSLGNSLKNKGIVDSGCSRHMTGNKAYLDEFQDFNGGPVAFGGSRGYITGKGFFTDSECLVLSPEFKLPDENQVLLKIPRQNNMYSFNLENIVPTGGLACLIAKATTDESTKWRRMQGHVIQNLNKLVKETHGIKREYSNARTPQQNRVAERKNKTLIEAARTMLADSFLPNTFWAEAVSTACYVLNRIIDVGDSDKEDDSAQDCFVLPIWPSYSSTNTPALTTDDKREGPREEEQVFMDDLERLKKQEKEAYEEAEALRKNTPAKASSTNPLNTASIPVSTASPYEGLSLADPTHSEEDDSEIPPLEDIYQNSTDGIFTTSSFDDEGAVADFTNLETVVNDYRSSADESWVDAMQEELLQFEIQKVWVLVDLPYGKKAIGTKWAYQNKKDERGVVVRNKANPKHPKKVYKVVKALYGLHQAPRAWSIIGSLMNLTASRTRHYLQSVLALDSDLCWSQSLTENPQTTGGCQFLGRRLISWQCKKQTIVATSTTEAEYVAAASCCGQVLWIQNQMLDYGFNFMNTKIYIDNESTICIVKNPVYHSKTKHIAIRHHFIRDAYEKKLIQVLKIHTDDNVADLLTKAFDLSRGLKEFRESLRRVTDGTEALLIPTLFILWLDKVSTDSANLVPLGKVCTALETLKKNTAKALISLLTTISLSSTMAVLDSCPKHNMVAYLEKSEGNAEFHEIIDFLKRSSIHHALTVSPVVSTTFVEQFWTSAKSKTINNVRHITAKVAGKSVSIRSDLLFDDADGIDSLPNQAIFDAIQLMSSKSTSWDQIPTNIATAVICLTSNQKYNFSKLIFDDKQLANVSVPLDHFPVNTLTSKVFSFMVKKGKHFSGKVTPLFATMLVQLTQDEGASSERPSEAQPTPSPAPTSDVPHEPQTDSSPAHTSEVPLEQQTDPSPRPSPTTTIPDSIPETSGGNLGDQAKEIQHLKAQITKLKKQAKPVIKHHRAWLKSVSLKQRFPSKSFSKKHRVHKESVSKQGRKFAKENAQDEGRTRDIVDGDKEIEENVLSTEDILSTDKEKVSSDRPIVSTDGSKVSTDQQIEGTDEQNKGTEDQFEEGSATQATQTLLLHIWSSMKH
ncbi:putative ribonuclease H-like domain-containing protein [Tanacetum coccineum]